MKKNGYVINLHLLEMCNYRCKHCFAHFDPNTLLSVDDWKKIIGNITRKISVLRFNLAGGEPLMYKGLDELIDYIYSKGIQVSIITNGFLLSEERIRKFNGKVSMVGLSIDALEPELLRETGRCTKSQELLDIDRCVALCKLIKENGIRLKINTVVTKLNQHVNFADFIATVQPDRWKLLKMKRFNHNGFDNSALEISEGEFKRFCSTYSNIAHIEEGSLKNSYIFVDAGGRLLDNYSDGHEAIANLLSEDFETAFNAMRFDKKLYLSRYELFKEERKMIGKVAVFVDGENISWRRYYSILKEIEKYGEIVEFRVYARWSLPNVKNWGKILKKNPAVMFQVFHDEKNAVDSYITLAAADMAYSNNEINTFCIVASDADYCWLSALLRHKGKHVVGIGEKHSSKEWQNSCDDFVILECSAIIPDEILEYGFNNCETDKDGWILIARFCELIKNKYPDFSWEQYGDKPTTVLEKYAHETEKIEIEKKHPNAYRIRRKPKENTEELPRKNSPVVFENGQVA